MLNALYLKMAWKNLSETNELFLFEEGSAKRENSFSENFERGAVLWLSYKNYME
jgi:hypothetical protein